MILLASWCALRFGELTELRRPDVVLDPDKGKGTIRVERAVVRVGDGFAVTTPKSDAGRRDVAVPPHLVTVLPSTWPPTSAPSRMPCCSRPTTVGTWPRPRCTGASTRPDRRPAAPIFASTTCGTPVPCWRRPVPRWPS